jgi:hypothetical protein
VAWVFQQAVKSDLLPLAGDKCFVRVDSNENVIEIEIPNTKVIISSDRSPGDFSTNDPFSPQEKGNAADFDK